MEPNLIAGIIGISSAVLFLIVYVVTIHEEIEDRKKE